MYLIFQMEKEIFLKNMNLFNIKVDVVFYDVTTFQLRSNLNLVFFIFSMYSCPIKK